MARVKLEHLVKDYRDEKGAPLRAVKSINLDIHDREFMVLVGPSGCGKSTTLRMIAGLEEITSGQVAIDQKIVNDTLPKDREIAMVFQNYALYPHMTVFENMAFGLKLMKHPKTEINARVHEAARLLDIENVLQRKPKALSGGQRQRVAVGRAIVRKPKVFLFDEPLSNLDAKMRVAMRTEISKLHTRLATTMIYVTHDQVEAMTMGDRICVMKDGDIMQVDTPLTIYNHPANMFVAEFIGSPPMNFIHGQLLPKTNRLLFKETHHHGDGIEIMLDDTLSRQAAAYEGKAIVLGVRSEDISDVLSITNPNPDATFTATVEVSEPMGSETYLYLDTGEHSLVARVSSSDCYKMNQETKLCINVAKCHLFDPETQEAVV